MRLLHLQDNGEFSLVEHMGNDIPPYAILSHTWGAEKDEVKFENLQNHTGKDKPGYEKIRFCGSRAKQDGLRYFWVDTCCINEANLTELSEAINSMFRWYRNADKCYVYLSDVSHSISERNDECSQRWKPAFRKSRWFTRGWTLQELIAPTSVEFFSKEGQLLGSKRSLEQTLHEITGIAIEALRGHALSQFSTNERLAWIAKRETKREEDISYCLLGIFDIHMTLQYGEGREKALERLQRKVRKFSSNKIFSLDDKQKRMLLDSLRFDQIDARQMTIKNAHAKTCKWLLHKREYLDWLDPTKLVEHQGLLWIKGKPGAGKSTLMKFALANARKTMRDRIMISFFFNARGEDIEKSTLGTYRSLLLQLLERIPALQCVFDSLGLSTLSISENHRWNVESLKTLLGQAIQSLGESSVVCFIDALDECEERQIRDMIQFFEHVGELTVSSGICFQVCFSSRHYPHISIQKGLGLVLEGQEGHNQDITNYLESELKIGKSKLAQQIRTEVQEKASGVFMWVVLVVGILNKEHDCGRIHTLQRRLRETPSDLHELFRDILTRDSHKRNQLVLCIQWVLFSKQPLTPEQLYFAILSGVEPNILSRWDPDVITKDVIRRFILDSSKGLAEITISKLQKVQFIHESVRDFLLKEDSLSNILPNLRSNLQGQSHERLKQCCLNYMSIDVFTPLKIPETLPKVSSEQAAGFRTLATDAFPFLEYAIHNVLYHADAAEGGGITQVNFLDSFPLSRWTKLDNLFEKYAVRRHTENVSFLYVLAERNMSNLIRTHLSATSCLEVENERYGAPLFAAIATKSKEAVQVFAEGLTANLSISQGDKPNNRYDQDERSWKDFGREFDFSRRMGVLPCLAAFGDRSIFGIALESGKFDIESKDRDGKTSLFWAVENGHGAIVKLLLDKGAESDSLFYEASAEGREQVVKLLLDNGANVNTQGGHHGSALQAASCHGHEQVVKLLLDNGANVNTQGGYYGNAFHAASCHGHEQVVKLLLDNGANINAQGGYYGNVLQAASCHGHEQVVKLLLDNGANVNAQGGHHDSALQAASCHGHEQVVKLLLDNGANVNAQGGCYSNTLQAASYHGHEQVVKLLLDNGANVNAQGGHHGSALQAASCHGHEQVVKLLLDNGANVNAQGGCYSNALQAASYYGHEQVVKLLLDNGANVNAQGGHYSSILQVALCHGHEQVVKLLLDNGANVNAQGGCYSNALQAASCYGHEQVVKLLLDNGANVNAQGGHHGSALQAASCHGHEQVVKLLLDNGANVNTQGGYYGNAFHAASYHGHEQVVKLLLDNGALSVPTG